MEQSCRKCGAAVNAEQAFCPKCGAVVGMDDAARVGRDEWDMASTFVSKKPASAPQPRRPTGEHARPVTGEHARSVTGERALHADAAPAPAHTAAPAPEPASGGKNTLLFALIGFVAVLIVGGLLIFLFVLNSKG
jgi:hypothetical protein